MQLFMSFLRVILPAALALLMAPPRAQATDPQPPAAASEAPNAITLAAVQRGALACASRVEQVSQFLGFGTPGAGALLLSAPAQPASHMLEVVLELPASAGSGPAYASTSFATVPGNGCDASYDAVAYSPQSCEALAEKQFKGMRKAGALAREVVVLDGGPATKVFLMPAGSGCVSIKKEVAW